MNQGLTRFSRSRWIWSTLGRAALLFSSCVPLGLPASDQSRLYGRVLDPISCDSDPKQQYAIYIPTQYSKEKRWPVIFCFDPRARGRIPVERLQVAAEKYGYIIAGSLNSRNGLWPANLAAIEAMINDVSKHFSIDPQRVYTTGLSGGARVASALALCGTAKGVIGCSAGFPNPDKIPPKIRFFYFGTAGTDDCNFREMTQLDDQLEKQKAQHHTVIFNGGHEWAPGDVMTDAVAWLELQGMRTGTRPKMKNLSKHNSRFDQGPCPPFLNWRDGEN